MPVLSPEPLAVFVALDHRGRKSASPEEAEIVARIVQALADGGCGASEIGIVVPYRRQARLIKESLAEAKLSREFCRQLVVDTVERMQGQEREVVIVSLTTSDTEFASYLRDFLFMPERLNVAITRARRKLIVVGSEAWRTDLPRTISEAALFARFLRECAIVPLERIHHG